jgi:hypothetical protein
MPARQIAIGFGIAVIFPLLVYYGVATSDPPPHMQFARIPSAPVSPSPRHA